MNAPSSRFRRLAFWTGVATLALIIVGGIVRVSDSGLGCGPAGSGLNGWPFCNGDVIPGIDTNAIIEYSHRALGAIVGLLVLAMVVLAFRDERSRPKLVRASVAAFVLVVAQGLLGAFVVEQNLDATLVAAHLGLAVTLYALLIYIWQAAGAILDSEPAVDPGPRFRAVALTAQAFLFLTIVAGGYMAGTQKFGRADFTGSGAHHACGTQFPTCNGGFLPFGQVELVDIHLTHRVFLYITTALLVWLVAMALRRRPSPTITRTALVTLGLLTTQLVVGALNVWINDIYEALIVVHLTLAVLLWGQLFALNLALSPSFVGADDDVPAPGDAEAVTA